MQRSGSLVPTVWGIFYFNDVLKQKDKELEDREISIFFNRSQFFCLKQSAFKVFISQREENGTVCPH